MACRAQALEPVICGDAHLGNFGFYASPERDLVFDLNDFDEAHPGPWEWDLWRLTTSIWVAGRQNGLTDSTMRRCRSLVRRRLSAANCPTRRTAFAGAIFRSNGYRSDATGNGGLVIAWWATDAGQPRTQPHQRPCAAEVDARA